MNSDDVAAFIFFGLPMIGIGIFGVWYALTGHFSWSWCC